MLSVIKKKGIYYSTIIPWVNIMLVIEVKKQHNTFMAQEWFMSRERIK